MPQAFDSANADFKGLCTSPPDGANLYIEDVIQKAMIAMQETGVEAAAATGVVMVRRGFRGAAAAYAHPHERQPPLCPVDRGRADRRAALPRPHRRPDPGWRVLTPSPHPRSSCPTPRRAGLATLPGDRRCATRSRLPRPPCACSRWPVAVAPRPPARRRGPARMPATPSRMPATPSPMAATPSPMAATRPATRMAARRNRRGRQHRHGQWPVGQHRPVGQATKQRVQRPRLGAHRCGRRDTTGVETAWSNLEAAFNVEFAYPVIGRSVAARAGAPECMRG